MAVLAEYALDYETLPSVEATDVESYGPSNVARGLTDLGFSSTEVPASPSTSPFRRGAPLLDWGDEPDLTGDEVQQQEHARFRQSWLQSLDQWLNEHLGDWEYGDWKDFEVEIPVLYLHTPAGDGVAAEMSYAFATGASGGVEITALGSGLGATRTSVVTFTRGVGCSGDQTVQLSLLAKASGREIRIPGMDSPSLQTQLADDPGWGMRIENVEPKDAAYINRLVTTPFDVDAGDVGKVEDQHSFCLEAKVPVGLDIFKMKATMTFTCSQSNEVTLSCELPRGSYRYAWLSNPSGVHFL